jgi:hypothetical protein
VNLAELKKQAEALPADERLELAAYLAELQEQSEPEFRRAVDERMKEMDRGSKVSSDEFEAQHLRRGKR